MWLALLPQLLQPNPGACCDKDQWPCSYADVVTVGAGFCTNGDVKLHSVYLT